MRLLHFHAIRAAESRAVTIRAADNRAVTRNPGDVPTMSKTIGCCSWSLQASSPQDLVERIHAVGVNAVQIALRPMREGAWSVNETRAVLAHAGIVVRSGMMETIGEDYSTLDRIKETGGVRPDARWSENLENARWDAKIAEALGVGLVTFHAGFLPHDQGDPERAKLVGRLREIHDVFADHGITVGLETGQESAATLLGVLEEVDRPGLGVNFDPANMILYQMGDPVDALERLSAWVKQIHVKDAVATRTPGEWGAEVAVGDGEVDWPAFFAVVHKKALDVDLMIEREAGLDRISDMRQAFEVVKRNIEER